MPGTDTALLAPSRPCGTPGCRRTTRGRYCSPCRQVRGLTGDQPLSSTAKGYRATWRRWRAETIARFNLTCCGDRPAGAPVTPDSVCRQLGLRTPGRTLDHIVPVSGPDDPTFYRVEAVQFLCLTCDQAKRQRESQRPTPKQRHVTRTGAESTTWG